MKVEENREIEGEWKRMKEVTRLVQKIELGFSAMASVLLVEILSV